MAQDFSVPTRAPARVWWPWLLVGIAWAMAVLATLLNQRILIDHHFLLEESGLPWPMAAAVFLACWQVMIVAMMVPASLPALVQVPATDRSGRHAYRALAAVFAGQSAVWTVFGLLAFAGDTLIHRLVDAWPWLAAHAFLIGATTFVIAGMFQFTRWKVACLAACRHPRAIGMAAAEHPRATRWRGMRYGCLSVGCCWALMLIMFGVGVGGLGWMVGLTGAMVSEMALRAVPMKQAIGIALLVLSGLWLAHPAWLVPAAAP
jgi:predicted metal-binding membrane protein